MRIVNVVAHVILLVLLYGRVSSGDGGEDNPSSSPEADDEEESKNLKFAPCKSCKKLVESIEKGMERTRRGKFEGGDSAWEEDKLGSYERSEVRLIEIQEHLCQEHKHGQRQCQALAEQLESHLEEWWFQLQHSHPDLLDFLCVQRAQQCCPPQHYGPQCSPCPGYPHRICNGNGRCKGAGTRKGNGKCSCDQGYQGEDCLECAHGFYQSYRDDKKLLCSACHRACNGSCSNGGPDTCLHCNSGWKMVADKGCQDINECLDAKTNPCPGNQFCVNNDGNFSCIVCDKACYGCSGDGPDFCVRCAEGYKRKNNVCVESDILERKSHENLARYVTYLGLTVATAIIFQRNIYAAGVIGVLVAMYISVSEYTVAYSGAEDTFPTLDILDKFLQ